MHYVVLGIGSNVSTASAMISKAVRRLTDETNGTILRASSQYVVNQPYVNQVVLMSTAMDYPTLHATTKAIEAAMGRTPQMKTQGHVPIDIDIIIVDGALKRPADYDAPYFREGYRDLITNY